MTNLIVALALLLACGDKDDDTGGTSDGGSSDGGSSDGGSSDGGSSDGGSSDGGASDGGSSDGGAAGGDLFFEASGTWDGAPFSVSCDESALLGASSGGTEPSINLICTDVSAGFGVSVAAIGPETGLSTSCDIYHWAQVTSVSDGAYFACTISAADSFALDLTEVVIDGKGNVTWAGSFSLVGSDDSHSVDVSGSFRGRSQVY